MNKPGEEQLRYEVITQEDPESGDLILPIPQPLLDQLGFKEGYELTFDLRKDGSILITKA